MYNDDSRQEPSRGRFSANRSNQGYRRGNAEQQGEHVQMSADGARVRPRFSSSDGHSSRPRFATDQHRPRFSQRPRLEGEGSERPFRPRTAEMVSSSSFDRTMQRESRPRTGGFSRPYDRNATRNPNAVYSNRKRQQYQEQHEDPDKPLRLNKFLANSGICSRREADDYIQAGVITVNGEIVTALGTKVLPTDKVMFHDQPIRRERKVYILLNKPKNCVTTTDDPQERMTVMDIVKCAERVYPVGRLDRNSTGVLLLTNDGDLAAQLTHPKYGKKKVYAVTLDRDLEDADRETLLAGVSLDDEMIVPDALEFTKEKDRKHIGIEIHSGQNRVVRRMFEKVGYKVMQLDRTSFAGITKKNVGRGKYRMLTPREIAMLKMGSF